MDRFELERANDALLARRKERRRSNAVPPGAFALEPPRVEPAPIQFELAIEHAPQRLRDHGYRDAHRWPLVSPDTGKVTRCWRESAREAWNYPRLELRTGNSWPCVIVDCDGAESVKRLGKFVLDEGLPTPNVIVQRRASGNVHAAYMIDPPVHRPCDSRVDVRMKPLRLLRRVSEYLTEALQGDAGYNGVLTHNPEWQGPEFYTDYLREEPWTLRELNNVIPGPWRVPARPLTAIGRNVGLFNWAVKEAHRPRSAEIIHAYGSPDCPEWERIVHAQYEAMYGNGGDLFRLPDLEIQGVARSAARYSLRQYSPRRFARRQAERGKASGAVRHEGSNEQARPWEVEGVHRATWYRRRARERATGTITDSMASIG